MKKIYTLISVLALCYHANSQTVIRNNSFENWNTFNSKQYPADWEYDSMEVQNGAIQKASPGSAGSGAVRLGCYLSGSVAIGGYVELSDTVTVKPGSLSFDYKTFNFPGFFDELNVELFLYDDVKLIQDVTFNTVQNSSSFQTATINISYAAGQIPKYYRIEVGIYNLSGSLNEYAILDNFRFGKNTGVETIGVTQKVNIWPNPATNVINISNLNEGVKTVNLISVDGKRTELTVENSSIDISGFSKGIYILEIADANGNLIKREKISIKG